LDFTSFVASPAETHAELARTVDDLSRWLAAVENGLAGVLERVGKAGVNGKVIEEEGAESETGREDESEVGET